MSNNVTREKNLEALANAIKDYADSKLATIGGGSAATIDDFTGASATTGGQSGLVPAPQAGDNEKFLRGDGTWVTIDSGETYSEATTLTAGLMSATDKAKLNNIANNANNYTLPTASTSTKGGVIIGNGLEMNGDTLNVTLSGGGQSYSIATSTQAGLMSAEDKQHLDAVFQDSADLTDAVITVVGGKFIPSVDSASDFNTYKDSNLPFLDNRLKKIINNTNNPYECPEDSWVFHDGTVTLHANAESTGTSIVSSNGNTIKISSFQNYIPYCYKLSETVGLLVMHREMTNKGYVYDGVRYASPIKVDNTGNVTALAGVSVCGAASSLEANGGWTRTYLIPSITDPNHILFLSENWSGVGTICTHSYTTIVHNAATGSNHSTKSLTNIGTEYDGTLNWASKTVCFNLQSSFKKPKVIFSEGQIIITETGGNVLPLVRYNLDTYNASEENTSTKSYVIIHHGLYNSAPAVLQLETWTSTGGTTDEKPWLEDDNNVIAGIYKTKSSPLCYAITFKKGTYNYSDDWYDKCSTVWKFDFLTPALLKTTLKLSEVIDELLL